MMVAPIYLDCNATTPIDPVVRTFMVPLLEHAYGNPHSEHAFGWEAAELIDEAQRHVADLIGASAHEIVFTSGATEANNHAIQGILRTVAGRRVHVVTSAIEHKSVLLTLSAMQGDNVEVEVLPVGRDGRIDPERVVDSLRKDTVLVTLGLANNEIGTIQPIPEIAALCKDRGVTFHTDAAQAVGRIPVDVVGDRIDLLSLSGHKLHGPKGIGALYVSRHAPVKPAPLIFGGGQQNGMRSGTVPAFLCAGLGEACRIAGGHLQTDRDHAASLAARMVGILREAIPDLAINGSVRHRLPGSLNIRIPGVDAEVLLSSLQYRIAASAGSACNAGLIEPSHVLRAIGLSSDALASSFRIGIGRRTTGQDIQLAAEIIAERAVNLRSKTLVHG